MGRSVGSGSQQTPPPSGEVTLCKYCHVTRGLVRGKNWNGERKTLPSLATQPLEKVTEKLMLSPPSPRGMGSSTYVGADTPRPAGPGTQGGGKRTGEAPLPQTAGAGNRTRVLGSREEGPGQSHPTPGEPDPHLHRTFTCVLDAAVATRTP